MWEQLKPELIKAIPNAIIAAVGALLALGIGKAISEYWEVRKKRRELELSTLNDFYRQYGEFFAVWKLWNQHLAGSPSVSEPQDVGWKLLERASAIEAGIEATLVKISAERSLTDEDIQNLGLLRQAFKSLRRIMRKGKELDWDYSEHEEYLAFKRLACRLTSLMLTSNKERKPTAEEAADALVKMTANTNESLWNEFRRKEMAKHKSKSTNGSDDP